MRATNRLLNLTVIFTALMLIAPPHVIAAPDSVAFFKGHIYGASVCVIQADLNDPTLKVDIGLPARGIAHSESFDTLVKRHAPLAAVTGIYFDMRTLMPTGTIVSDGKTIYESHIGTAVCFTPDNKVAFMDAKFGRTCDLGNAECGFRTGPRLLANGQFVLNARLEGFRHPGLFGARTRIALGVTPYNKLQLVLVRTPVTFAKLATVMKTLGSVDAVCLDGGTSAAMYYDGKLIKRPGRTLTNVIEIHRRTVPTSVASVQANGVVIEISEMTQQSRNCTVLPNDAANGANYIIARENVAILADPIKLRAPKCFHTLFPVNWA